MCSVTEQSQTSIRPGDNVLVCCPSFTGAEPRACLDLLTPDGSTDVHALSVLFTQSPGDHVDAWQRIAGAYPTRMRIVAVDADARSDRTDETAGPDADRSVERVGSPHNLTRLGIRVADCLDEWDGSAETVVVCFQSLTTLLQYVDVESAVEFLDVVTERCAATDAVAHYHLDPEAHDDETIDRLSELFETTLRFDDGEWTVRAGGEE
ncbi:hypothetical protein HZS55_05310 [Halosimplex rubrum]|uniref:Recombinase RecA n=1 Tax=Halosimplex rubrum TaxID=869889 RepID=A0A7D5TBV7_9EURY|nr:hypothetical protein [Halosimplex rubrum]QLH76756.1 hypothetical protein HZS55_05310 [Halosimplex rubrum]